MKSIIFCLIAISAPIIACDISALLSSSGISSREYKEVNIGSIYDTYDANPIRGKKLYENQYLRIEDYVFHIGSSDQGDGPELLLQENPPKSFLGISIDSGSIIETNFSNSESDDVALLSIGNKVIVECRGQGFEKDFGNFGVPTQSVFWLDQCRFQEFGASE